jgi:hypothetical protein
MRKIRSHRQYLDCREVAGKVGSRSSQVVARDVDRYVGRGAVIRVFRLDPLPNSITLACGPTRSAMSPT